MQTTKKLTLTTAILSILLMTSALMMAAPAQAQIQYTNIRDPHGQPLPAGVTPDISIKTYPSLSVSPNPIGVGESLLVNMWLHPPYSNARYTSGYMVTFTKPDGTKDTKGPIESYQGDTTAWFEYAVDQVGTWKVKLDFPGNYFPAGNYTSGQLIGFSSYGQVFSMQKSCYYQPSTTGDQEFVVQQEQVYSYPPSALPTDYWTRPISPVNREWQVIAGNWPWPYANNYSYGGPYTIAPNSSHIVWKQLGGIMGLVGGEQGQLSLTTGYTSDSPTMTSNPPLIYSGRCYQTMYVTINGVPTSCAVCYDLRTGQQYYAIPTAQGGVTPTVISDYRATLPAVAGDLADLGPVVRLLSIGTNLIWIDPFTGAVRMNVTGMSGTFYNDPYVLSVQSLSGRYRLINWTTEDLVKAGGMVSTGTNTNFTQRIISNISWPVSSLGTCDFNAGVSVTSQSINDDAYNATQVTMNTRLIGVSLTTGQVLWNITTDDTQYSGSTAVADNGKYCFAVRDSHSGRLDAWDLRTGTLAWQSDELAYPWGFGGAYAVASAYGLVYRFSYAGIYAINWTNGKIAWHFMAPATQFEAPWYPSESFDTGAIVADGKLFVANSEHSATEPIARDWKMWALNATSGEEIWNITGSWGTPGPTADGYLVSSNSFDGYLYAFGKGKSSTTVTATPAVISSGASVLIQGTVMDQSPAQPNTPCVSKDSMTTEMEHLQMQKPIDGIYHNATMTGVPVALAAIGSDGTVINIGTVTSNAYYGTFSKAWAPPKQDTYTITASFAGDDSYGSSSAGTATAVGPAPTTPQIPETIVPDYTMTIVYGVIAIIAAVAIVGLLIFLGLRKR